MLLALWFLMVSGLHVTAAPNDVPPSDGNQTSVETEVVHYRYKVVRSYPHDRQAFTQGLVYENGIVYEGTGLHRQSAITARDLKTGKLLRRLRLADKHFGEGITIFPGVGAEDDKLIQLTWRSNVGFIYKKDTFTLLRQFTYPTEGWGLTHDGQRLLYSDGTATLHLLDPNTCAETGRIEVRDRGRLVRGLNELEYVATPPLGVVDSDSQPGAAGPQIYANIWPTDRIVIIDPKTGRVTGWLDLTGLYTPPGRGQSENVLNGIAYLPETKHLLLTGKCWPKLYEIELVKQTPRQ